MILAILRAQWLSMRTFRMSSKPAATIFSNITGLLFYGFWGFAALGFSAFLSNRGNRELFPVVLPPALLVMFLYWQLTPIVTASMGASLNLKKLLVYPIPTEKLFFVEVLLRIATCGEMVIMLGGVMLGILRNPEMGGVRAIPRLVLAGSIFAGFNFLLSAGLRNLLERMMRRRRMRELMTLILVAISVLPQFLLRSSNMSMDRLKNVLPVSPLLPWNAAASILLGLGIGQPVSFLLFFLALAYVFGRWQFNASLRFDGESDVVRKDEPRPGGSRVEAFLRFPARFLPDPIAAIVEKETLSLSRMAPFRMIFVMGSALGVLLWLPQMMGSHRSEGGFMSENILSLATAYGVLVLGQVNYFNSFGFDRSSVQTWFSVPVSMEKVITGKNIASAWFVVLEILLTTLVCAVCRIPLTPLRLIEGACVGSITALYLISFGNLTSTRIPRPMNPEKVNQGGASKVLNTLVLLSFPIVLAPVVLAFWARAVFSSELIFFLLLAVAAAFGGIFYWVATGSAAEAARNRKEKILSDLSRDEGPVSIS
jgi:ABC-2 type transport system permease protein